MHTETFSDTYDICDNDPETICKAIDDYEHKIQEKLEITNQIKNTLNAQIDVLKFQIQLIPIDTEKRLSIPAHIYESAKSLEKPLNESRNNDLMAVIHLSQHQITVKPHSRAQIAHLQAEIVRLQEKIETESIVRAEQTLSTNISECNSDTIYQIQHQESLVNDANENIKIVRNDIAYWKQNISHLIDHFAASFLQRKKRLIALDREKCALALQIDRQQNHIQEEQHKLQSQQNDCIRKLQEQIDGYHKLYNTVVQKLQMDIDESEKMSSVLDSDISAAQAKLDEQAQKLKDMLGERDDVNMQKATLMSSIQLIKSQIQQLSDASSSIG